MTGVATPNAGHWKKTAAKAGVPAFIREDWILVCISKSSSNEFEWRIIYYYSLDMLMAECPKVANAANLVRRPKNLCLLYLHVKIVAENEFFSLFH